MHLPWLAFFGGMVAVTHGTTATGAAYTLVAAQESGNSIVKTVEGPSGEATPALGAVPPTIMVVEDDSIVRVLLEMTLEDAGFPVLALRDADAAIRAFGEGRRIGVVVTDVRMPGSLDGLGLAGWMRDHAPNVPVILVSGYPMQPLLLEVNPAIAIVVRKPYDPHEIVGWVSSLLH